MSKKVSNPIPEGVIRPPAPPAPPRPKGFDSFWEDNKSMFLKKKRPRPIVKE